VGLVPFRRAARQAQEGHDGELGHAHGPGARRRDEPDARLAQRASSGTPS
jgi:hypothetical protein